MLINNDTTSYLKVVTEFTNWCELRHFLLINVKKTKELIVDFRRNTKAHDPLCISGLKVERVNEYKYLGTVIDDKLNWNENSKVLYGKANQRLFFLRKLRKFNVDINILTCFIDQLCRVF